MSNQQFHTEMQYLSAIAVVRNLLRQGLVTEEEYTVIDTKLQEKFTPSLGTLLSENDLITGAFRGIYGAGKE